MKCYEYFDCEEKTCPMFKDENTACWGRDDTLCNNLCFSILKRHGAKIKEEDYKLICSVCSYYISKEIVQHGTGDI